MTKHLERFEKVVVTAIVVMAALVLLLCTIDLAWLILTDLTRPPYVLLRIEQLLELFSFFLLVLIGVELLETTKVYFAEQVINVESVMKVALIAVARKVIVLDIKDSPALSLLGIAALVIAVGLAYRLVR